MPEAALHARSSAEAHLYMAIHPCAACGDGQFDAVVRNSLVGGAELVTTYTGPCRTCRSDREFRFRFDESSGDDEAHGEPEFGRGTPSTIVDAGQWLRCADRILGTTPSTVLGVSDEEWRARRFLFKAAAESVGEVLKFIPDGAESVPEHGFWTVDGRAERDRAPERFHRAGLERMRLACLDLAATYES